MSMNVQGRPTRPETAAAPTARQTFTGNRGLNMEEALIFESGRFDATGVDIDEPPAIPRRNSGPHGRQSAVELPGLTEPEAIRHYVRLSRNNYSIDAGLYPLGSCTMKHNPRLNEKMARLPGFADVHPLQPVSTAQGALELIEALSDALLTMTGMDAIAMSPKAGAHGELCGMMAIKAAIEARGEGETRRVVLVPDSAHGTNPATAALIGYSVRSIPAGENGIVSVEAVRSALAPDVAAIMLTNPNTCGLFEREIVDDRGCGPRGGSLLLLRRREFQRHRRQDAARAISASTPCTSTCTRHSRPRMGAAAPARVRSRCRRGLRRFAPVPFVKREGGALRLVEHADGHEIVRADVRFPRANGDVRARAQLSFCRTAPTGFGRRRKTRCLSANYIRASLGDVMSAPFGDQALHA